jgi:hypothetical protein
LLSGRALSVPAVRGARNIGNADAREISGSVSHAVLPRLIVATFAQLVTLVRLLLALPHRRFALEVQKAKKS